MYTFSAMYTHTYINFFRNNKMLPDFHSCVVCHDIIPNTLFASASPHQKDFIFLPRYLLHNMASSSGLTFLCSPVLNEKLFPFPAHGGLQWTKMKIHNANHIVVCVSSNIMPEHRRATHTSSFIRPVQKRKRLGE